VIIDEPTPAPITEAAPTGSSPTQTTPAPIGSSPTHTTPAPADRASRSTSARIDATLLLGGLLLYLLPFSQL